MLLPHRSAWSSDFEHADAEAVEKLVSTIQAGDTPSLTGMYTARTGEVGRNEAGVEHFVAAKESASSDLARFALDWRSVIPTPWMKKVAVFGNAGGKSTLAKRMAELTRLPLYPVDIMQWRAGVDAEMRAFLAALNKEHRLGNAGAPV